MVEVETLVEVYNVAKGFLAKKERQEFADTLVSVIADFLDEEELRKFLSVDAYLKKAAEYNDLDVQESDYDEYD